MDNIIRYCISETKLILRVCIDIFRVAFTMLEECKNNKFKFEQHLSKDLHWQFNTRDQSLFSEHNPEKCFQNW